MSSSTDDARSYAPATQRNREPILQVLRQWIPESGFAVEIACGSGEHLTYFAEHFPQITWLGTDPSLQARQSTAAWIHATQVNNAPAPIELDAAQAVWPLHGAAKSPQVFVNINMVHIAPWDACQGLMRGAGTHLEPGGVLYMYGPFKVDGQHTAPSNVDFDAWLKERDSRWGIRNLKDVVAEGEKHGLHFEAEQPMPANNFSLIFRRGK